ncbi:MAG: succinate dehydrogenase, hydrophobic membrane anchor protein [Betaproteobacteria bacterium]
MFGLRAWLIQRASAVYMLGFIVWVLLRWLLAPPRSYEAWHAWISGAGTAIAAALFSVALLAHAWVGLRDVMLDYIPSLALRAASLALLAAAMLAIGAWVLAILARAALV